MSREQQVEGRHPVEETQETNQGDRQQAQCRILNYESPWKIYASSYSWRQDRNSRFALGSFLEDKSNKVFLSING